MTTPYESLLGDVHQIVTYDGKTLTIPDNETVFRAFGNYGAPPIEFITRKGYKQHGSTFIDYNIQDRSVNVGLYQSGACSRAQYWAYRAELHNLLRPNRGGPITLILRQAGGEKRALKVWANPGATFAAQDTNNWSIDESLDFTAFDPFWYDPDTVSADVGLTGDSDLIFPITFPIKFGIAGAQFNYPIVYTGSWASYPILTLSGPYASATIENLATGVKLSMVQGISENDQRIIDLTPGSQSITDANGVNYFSDLAPGANLVQFAIQPDPIVPGGVQTIRATLQGARVYSGTGWKVQNQILAPNRWYRLNDTTSTAIDIGSDNASGVYIGGYTQGVAGAIAGAAVTPVTLAGSTGTIQIPALPLQGISWTIQGWLKVASLVGTPAFFSAFGDLGSYQQMTIYVNASGALVIDFAGGVTFTSANGVFATGAYRMITVAYNKATATLRAWINGTLVINTAAADFIAAAPACYFGSFNAATLYANGQLDEAQVWLGRALTTDEVQTDYASRLIASRQYTPSGFHIDFNKRYYGI